MRRIALFTSIVLVTFACKPKTDPNASPNSSPYRMAITEKTLPDGLTLEEVDLNGDGEPEIFNYYREREDSYRLLIRKDADLNMDGRVDVRSWFTDTGKLELEEMDGDFDGQYDMWDHYQDTDGDGAPERVASEVDTDFDGKADMFTYYRDGKVIRKERDTNGDDRIDHWEKFDAQGVVVKSGSDSDYDGNVDQRDD